MMTVVAKHSVGGLSWRLSHKSYVVSIQHYDFSLLFWLPAHDIDTRLLTTWEAVTGVIKMLLSGSVSIQSNSIIPL